MEYRVLGRLEVVRDGEDVDLGSHRQKALLAMLLCNPNSIVSTDRLIDEIWGDDASSDRQNSLWVYVSNLRKALDPEREKRSEGTVLLTRAPGYLLHVDESDVDATKFEQMVAEGKALLETDPGAASLVLGEALALWHGKAFEDFVYENFAQAEIARLEELRLEAVEDRVNADLRRGMSRELVSELESLVRQHPTRERLTGQLMLALYRSGRQAEALHAFQLLKSRLGEELGIEPSNQLRKLEERIVTNDPALLEAAVRLPGAGPEPGMAVRGYELREKLGEGGFGVVYRAYQPAVGREVAIKVIRPELADNAAFIRRFEEEARLVARLEHPHIIPLYDYWREPGAAYLVMRYMKAGNLGDAIAGGPLPPDRVRLLVEHVGTALETAHRNGIVHRDIKPANILLDERGNAYLSDFGIATGAGAEAAPDESLPSTLTAPYASPEQLEKGTVTPASDVYSFAVVVAQAMAGRDGEVAEMRVGMSPAAAEVIGDAVTPDRMHRYPDAGAFTAAMLDALGIEEEVEFPGVVVNPYKGLRAFGQADAEHFFGRERFVERLVARLGRPDDRGRFVAVVGPSGCGKSSAVRAGLLPALRVGAAPGSERWFQIEMTPGRYPFEELESALLAIAVNPPATLLEQLKGEGGIRRAVRRVLPDDESQLVIVVDQFEELFTQSDPDTAGRFLTSLAEAIDNGHSRIKVVATLRADFYDRPLQHRVFGELLRDGTEVVTPMTADELERAITGPAGSVGVSFEPALVASMVADVADRPAALPLMQYALTEVFDQRLGTTVPAAAYQELGGVSGALVERAESLIRELTPEQQEAARHVFLRLVTIGEGGADDTRRRALLSELTELTGTGPHAQVVVDTFGRHRLLAFDRDLVTRGPTVEISHEALLREWKRLARWIDDARADVLAQRRLSAAAGEWVDRDQSPDFVFTGGQLASYDGWLEHPPVHLTARETEFLRAGVARQAEIEAHEAEEVLRETKLRTRSRLLAGLSAISVVIVALAVFAFLQRRAAQDSEQEAREAEAAAVASEQEARSAEAEALEAEAETRLALDDLAASQAELTRASESSVLAARSQEVRAQDPQLAVLLALEAARLTGESGYVTPHALDALHLAAQEMALSFPADETTPIAIRTGPSGSRGVYALAPNDLLSFLQGEAARPFTPEECTEYFDRKACPDPAAAFPAGLAIFQGDQEYGVVANTPEVLAQTTTILRSPFWDVEEEGLMSAIAEVTDWVGAPATHFAVNTSVAEAARGGEGPVDISFVAQPAEIGRLVAEGRLVDLSTFVDADELRASFGGYLTDLVTFENAAGNEGIYGIPIKLDVKSLVWYPVEEFEAAGYEIPATWDDMMDLGDTIVSDGGSPFCLAIFSGLATGWIPTDWIETIILRSQGPEFYDQWVSHEIPFNHPAVVAAITEMGRMAFTEGYSLHPAVSVPDWWFGAMFMDMALSNPPKCWLTPQASFAPGATDQPLVSGVDYGAFRFPSFNPSFREASVGGGAFAVALSDRPEVRALMKGMMDPAWGSAWVNGYQGWLPAHHDFDLSTIEDSTIRTIAAVGLEALDSGQMRFDGSDLMPQQIGGFTSDTFEPGIFWSEMVRYFREGSPDNYRQMAQEIADNIEAAWVALEAEQAGAGA